MQLGTPALSETADVGGARYANAIVPAALIELLAGRRSD